MRRFTDNPLEALMQQVPSARRESHPAAPKGHPCHGCNRYGEGCVAPCYRDLLKLMQKEDTKT